MSDNTESFSIYLDDAISKIAEIKLTRIVPPILQTMVNEKFSEAPEWFTSEMNNIKSGLTALETKVDDKFAVMEVAINSLESRLGTLESRLGTLESRLDTLEYGHLRLFNYLRRTDSYDAVSIPFLNTEENQEELPPILSVHDIDRLNKEQCQKYLNGYRVMFHPNETVKLKERLRDALGLLAGYDCNYRFTTFS